jgi:GNAT superfamily N-acetyltransferase
MEEIIIRKATVDDIEYLLQFEQGIIEAEKEIDKTLKREKIYYYDLKAMLESPNIELAIAEINNVLIGSGYARIEKAKPRYNYKQYALLGFMYVLPEYRGKGVNKKIIDYLIKWVHKQEITELRLEVYAENISAIKAYEKTGFVKDVIEMRLEIH